MGKKVLIVDDEVELVDMLKVRAENAGYEIITAYDGQEALDKARAEKPDIVVLDILLPKLDGYQVCRMLKFDKTMEKTPIIILTALVQKEDRDWGKRVMADVYITKPFNADELMEKLDSFSG